MYTQRAFLLFLRPSAHTNALLQINLDLRQRLRNEQLPLHVAVLHHLVQNALHVEINAQLAILFYSSSTPTVLTIRHQVADRASAIPQEQGQMLQQLR